jgi:ABC-type Fe3+ transport system permease subunit
MQQVWTRLAILVVLVIAILVFSRPVRVGSMDRGSGFPVELPPIVIGVSNVQSGPQNS